MIKRLLRTVFLAAVAAAGLAAVKAMTRKDDPLPAPAAPTGGPWPPLRNETAAPKPASAPEPAAAKPAPKKAAAKKAAVKKAAAKRSKPLEAEPAAAVSPEPDGVPVSDAGGGEGWVDNVDGECPPGYPIKANMNSKIFHSPGQLNYERTHPDRCYASAEAAEADGLRAAKR